MIFLTDDGDVIGFQAKYYDETTQIKDKEAELKKAIKDAKTKYGDISRFIIYTNKELSTSSIKTKVKPQYQVNIEKCGSDIGINVENALRTIKSRQNFFKELMQRVESAQHNFNFSAETRQYLQTLLQELGQIIRKSEWFYRDYWFLKQEEMAKIARQIIEELNALIRREIDKDLKKVSKDAEERLKRLIEEFLKAKKEYEEEMAAIYRDMMLR